MNASAFIAVDLRAELADLARAVGRLRPDWRDAERYYEARSEIIGRLRTLADGGAVPRPLSASLPSRPTPASPPVTVRVVALRPSLLRPPRRYRYPLPPTMPDRQLNLLTVFDQP